MAFFSRPSYTREKNVPSRSIYHYEAGNLPNAANSCIYFKILNFGD